VEDSIVYKQWVHDGLTKVVFVANTFGESTEKICQSANQATSHCDTTKSQALYLKTLKGSILPDTEAVILFDFSENYSILCQDAIHGFQWELDQSTFHHFIVCYCTSQPENIMREEYVNSCAISDCLEHRATTVQSFMSGIIHHLVFDILLHLLKIYYSSNGAGAQ
jgi:hypothetical protein